MILLAGLGVIQFVLFGPSLVGKKLLLPLDILTAGNQYLSADPRDPHWRPPQTSLPADIVQTLELHRRLAAEQVRRGQLPLWNPYSYCGAPLLAANQAAVFSPFSLLSYAFPEPQVVAWIQFCKALVGGVGAFLFFRRVLRVGYWPATFGAWCFPLTGFLVFWAGYPLSQVALWLPWMLLTTDAAVHRPGLRRGWGGPALALVTVFVLFAGHPAMAAAVLMVSGFFFLWSLIRRHGWSGLLSKPAIASVLTVTCAWMLGAIMSMPQTLPATEYLQYSWRAAERARGQVDFPPVGPAVLPMIVLPNIYGTANSDSVWMDPSRGSSNQYESVSSAYAGLLAALVLMPLAWCSRRHRAISLFLLALGFFGVAQPLNVPLLVEIFRVPPLTLTQNNRWVFLTGFAILSLGVIGLDVLYRRELRWRWWFSAPASVLAGLAGWCALRAAALPAPVQRQVEPLRQAIAQGQVLPPQALRLLDAFEYRWHEICLTGVVLCLLGLALWACLGLRWLPRRRIAAIAGVLMILEMVWFAYGVNPQTDPKLYYPRIPALAALHQGMSPAGQAPPQIPPGRILGVHCLMPALNLSHGLSDIRGYDAIDPIHLVELLSLCRDPRSTPIHYSALQLYAPEHADEIELLSPIIHMLNVRYLIYWRHLPERAVPLLKTDPYAVVENPRVLPRVFVPRQVEVVPDKAERLARLGSADFDPQRIAYIETPLPAQPALPVQSAGQGRIVEDGFDRVEISLDMQTAGLVVLSDLWFPGWHAYLDGRELPLHRTNHALRGAIVPAGEFTLVFSYQPASVTWGLRLGSIGFVLLGCWTALVSRGRDRGPAR